MPSEGQVEKPTLRIHNKILGLLAVTFLAETLAGCASASGPTSPLLNSGTTKAAPIVEKVTGMPSLQCLEKPPLDAPSLETCLRFNGNGTVCQVKKGQVTYDDEGGVLGSADKDGTWCVAYPVTITDPVTHEEILTYKVITNNEPEEVVNVPIEDICCLDLRAAVQEVTKEPAATVIAESQPTPSRNWEITQSTIDEVAKGLLDPSQYSSETIKAMENLLKSGSQGRIYGYNVGAGTIYLQVEPEGKLPKRQGATALTQFRVIISNLQPEGKVSQPYILIPAQSLRDRGQWQAAGFSSKIQEKLDQIDDQHEALVFLTYLRGINILLERCGINSAQSLPDQSIQPDDYNQLINLLNVIVSELHPYTEITAEMADATLIAQLAERNGDGSFRTVGIIDSSTGKLLYLIPVINGKPYDDYGHFMQIVKMLPSSLWKANSFTEIPFSSIPPENLEAYIKQMKEVFSP